MSIKWPALTIAGATCNPSVAGAFLLPTAFSGVTVTYGGESCVDNPEPGTIAGDVFIPEHHRAFYPKLADPVSLRATINEQDMRVTAGILDELTVKDTPGVHELPQLIPNSRAMLGLTGWAFRHGTSWDTGTALAGEYIAGAGQVTATAPVPADFGRYTFIRPPLAPVDTTGSNGFIITAMGAAAIGYPEFTVDFLNAAGAVLYSTKPYIEYVGGAYKSEWTALRTSVMWAPWGTVNVRITSAHELDPTAAGFEQEAGIDGIVLHQLPAGTDQLPKLRPAGRWVRFKATDVLGAAGRLVVGTTPWPQQTIEGRTQALNDIVPATYVTFGFGSRDPYQLLAPRDIDKQNALEVYQRILASSGDLAIAATWPIRGVVPAPLPRFAQVLADVGGVAEIVTDPGVPELPAGAIIDDQLQTDVTTMANQVRLEYREITSLEEQTAEDANRLYVNAASINAFGAMARSIATDLADPAGTVAESKAKRIADAQAQPFYRLADRLRLVSSQIPDAPAVAKLYSAETGFTQLVHVPDGPAELGEFLRVRGAVLTFGRLPAVELDVEPAGYAAPEPVSFAETLGTPPAAPFDTLTLGDFTNVTLGQLATVSTMED